MPAQGTVLVTGGAGYIGSHTCVALLQAGWAVVVVDDFSNSSPVALDRVRALAPGGLAVERADIADRAAIDRVLAAHPVDAVIHFAGRKAVGESVRQPLEYYANNVTGTVHLLQALQAAGVRRFVFSSSATVYGVPDSVPVTEEATLTATNPYGRTKLHIEDILRDLAASDDTWRILLLRYFNPVGAHPSGRIGEDPRDVPNNLMPFVMQVAVGRRPEVVVSGTTTRRPTAPASATTYTSRTWPPATSPPSSDSTGSTAPPPSTSAPVMAARCSRSSGPPRRPSGAPSRTGRAGGAPVTPRRRGPTPRRPTRCWTGRPVAASRRCVLTTGAGSRPTPRAMEAESMPRSGAMPRRAPVERPLVVPTFLEAANIVEALERIRATLPDAEVLVVDDGTPDGTADLAEAAGARLGGVHVMRRPGKGGLGSAYREGFAWGLGRGYDALVEMDADLSHDAGSLPDLLRPLGQGADLVIGSRYVHGGSTPDWPKKRALLSRGGNRYAGIMLGFDVRDSTAGYRAYAADLLAELELDAIRAEGYAFQIEMTRAVHQAGGQIREVAISFSDRVEGTSKMSGRIVIEALALVTWWGVRDRLRSRGRAR